MKKSAIAVILFILLAGCAEVGTKINLMEDAFRYNKTSPAESKIGLLKYGYGHFGNTKLEVLSPLLLLTKTQRGEVYSLDLAPKCFSIMEEVISNNTQFKFSSPAGLEKHATGSDLKNRFEDHCHAQMWGTMAIVKDKEEIARFIESNELDGALQINVVYGHSESIHKRMALRIDWVVFKPNGEQALNVRTYYESKDPES